MLEDFFKANYTNIQKKEKIVKAFLKNTKYSLMSKKCFSSEECIQLKYCNFHPIFPQ